mmetsp:Transcript_27027/g.48155  ORF Transcript_27027/g.48155 Transcript_27027/m.48155 type:complete len:229 (-) Transcript_27027:160-846(-)
MVTGPSCTCTVSSVSVVEPTSTNRNARTTGASTSGSPDSTFTCPGKPSATSCSPASTNSLRGWLGSHGLSRQLSSNDQRPETTFGRTVPSKFMSHVRPSEEQDRASSASPESTTNWGCCRSGLRSEALHRSIGAPVSVTVNRTRTSLARFVTSVLVGLIDSVVIVGACPSFTQLSEPCCPCTASRATLRNMSREMPRELAVPIARSNQGSGALDDRPSLRINRTRFQC